MFIYLLIEILYKRVYNNFDKKITYFEMGFMYGKICDLR